MTFATHHIVRFDHNLTLEQATKYQASNGGVVVAVLEEDGVICIAPKDTIRAALGYAVIQLKSSLKV